MSQKRKRKLGTLDGWLKPAAVKRRKEENYRDPRVESIFISDIIYILYSENIDVFWAGMRTPWNCERKDGKYVA